MERAQTAASATRFAERAGGGSSLVTSCRSAAFDLAFRHTNRDVNLDI